MPAKVDETDSSDSQGGSASYRHTQLCHCGNLTVSLPSETTNNVRASSLPLIESTLDLSCLGSLYRLSSRDFQQVPHTHEGSIDPFEPSPYSTLTGIRGLPLRSAGENLASNSCLRFTSMRNCWSTKFKHATPNIQRSKSTEDSTLIPAIFLQEKEDPFVITWQPLVAHVTHGPTS